MWIQAALFNSLELFRSIARFVLWYDASPRKYICSYLAEFLTARCCCARTLNSWWPWDTPTGLLTIARSHDESDSSSLGST